MGWGVIRCVVCDTALRLRCCAGSGLTAGRDGMADATRVPHCVQKAAPSRSPVPHFMQVFAIVILRSYRIGYSFAPQEPQKSAVLSFFAPQFPQNLPLERRVGVCEICGASYTAGISSQTSSWTDAWYAGVSYALV